MISLASSLVPSRTAAATPQLVCMRKRRSAAPGSSVASKKFSAVHSDLCGIDQLLRSRKSTASVAIARAMRLGKSFFGSSARRSANLASSSSHRQRPREQHRTSHTDQATAGRHAAATHRILAFRDPPSPPPRRARPRPACGDSQLLAPPTPTQTLTTSSPRPSLAHPDLNHPFHTADRRINQRSPRRSLTAGAPLLLLRASSTTRTVASREGDFYRGVPHFDPVWNPRTDLFMGRFGTESQYLLHLFI